MSSPYKTNKSPVDSTEKLVVKYLRDDPSFFERHLDLLADMILPHDQLGTVSLMERQVQILREQKDSNKRKLNQLIQNAQINEKLSSQVNQLILALLDVPLP